MLLFLSEGRLGNQLFQYAFLNTIAKKNEKIIAVNMDQFVNSFDIRNNSFMHQKIGKYGLYFTEKILTPYILTPLINIQLLGYIQQQRSDTSAMPSYVRKMGILPLTLVEKNYFQSEELFDKDKIDFKIKSDYVNEAKTFLSQVPEGCTKVFIHVRRGDYISEKYLGVQGIDLPMSYYKKAMNEIVKELRRPFFIFLSDDFDYVKFCFKMIDNKIISKNSLVTDLAIMSLCEYGIISNSSFSWWGAFLMNNRKRVISPRYWYGWKQKIESHLGVQPEWAEVIDFEW